MKQDIQRISELAVRRARMRLERKGLIGESARMRNMADRHIAMAREVLERNWEKCRDAGARRIVRDLALVVCQVALTAELNTRK